MTVSRLRQHRQRAWFAALLVPLLCLRAFLPIGFMPELGLDGWVTLQLCTASGLEPRRVQIDPLGAATNLTSSEPSPHGDRSDCAYAHAASASPTVEVPRLPESVCIATPAIVGGVAVAAAGPLARSQSARGPPASLG